MSIPITVGVTGHRDLREEDLPKLHALVHEELRKLKTAYPDSPFQMLNSLASGADTLCAQEALAMGFDLICPLPVELEIYKKDFSPEEAEELETLLVSAKKVFVAPEIEPFEDSRRYRFRQAGIYVATHCHILLALWDGSEAKDGGCGTAEAVDFMLNGYEQTQKKVFGGDEGAVIHVKTPRMKKPEMTDIGVQWIENCPGKMEKILEKTNAFNRDAQMKKRAFKYKMIPKAMISKENREAAALAKLYQRRYLQSLLGLSMMCVALVMSYLIYDEGDVLLMLPLYAVVLALYYLLYRLIGRGKYHEKYIQYRMLAESLRVQHFLCALDLNVNVGEFYTWTQQEDSAWIRCAIRVLREEEYPERADEAWVKKNWIEDQLKYHRAAYTKNHQKDALAGTVSKYLLISTLGLFVLVFILELLFPNLMSQVIVLSLRGWLKILWGTISAVALFVSGYYGNLSFERKAEDNKKMIPLFEKAKAEVELGITCPEEFYRELAREEIIENGNWASYCMENRPVFTL